MSSLTTRYPPYPSGMGPRRIIDSGGYPITRSISPYDRDSRYLIERPDVISRTRSYHNCHCGLPISHQGDHLCRSCHLITHAANQVLNIRGGDHCDCKGCTLALEDEERELEALDSYEYYSSGSDICRSCGRRNCPLDCRPERLPLLHRRTVSYSAAREPAYIRRDPMRELIVRPSLLATRARSAYA